MNIWLDDNVHSTFFRISVQSWDYNTVHRFFAWAVIKLFWRAIFGLFDFWCCYNLWLSCWHLQLKFCSVGSIAPLLISVLNTRANDVICNPTTTVKPYGMYLLLFVEKTLMLWVFWTNNLHRKGYCKADKMYHLCIPNPPSQVYFIMSGIVYVWNHYWNISWINLHPVFVTIQSRKEMKIGKNKSLLLCFPRNVHFPTIMFISKDTERLGQGLQA